METKTLWAFGDSWTAAAEVPFYESYAALVSKKLNYRFINLARGGSSNHEIAKQIQLTRRNIQKDDLVIVGWTTPHRDISLEIRNLKVEDTWDKHLRRQKKIGSELTDIKVPIKDWLRILNKGIDLLEGLDYVMTQAFNPVFGYDYIVKPSDIKNPKKFIGWGKPNYTMCDMVTNNFLAENTKSLWMTKDSIKVRKNLYMEPFFASDNKHPSQHGHKIIAEYIYNFISKNKTNFI
tara:strand:+ start:1111 stop:1815 length:705 start_codon:yes stop_codon:yes gene_type:complete